MAEPHCPPDSAGSSPLSARSELDRRVARNRADEAGSAGALQRSAQVDRVAIAGEAPDRQAIDHALTAGEAGSDRGVALQGRMLAGHLVPGESDAFARRIGADLDDRAALAVNGPQRRGLA